VERNTGCPRQEQAAAVPPGGRNLVFTTTQVNGQVSSAQSL